MKTTTADAKKRVLLSDIEPGEVFDVQRQGDGRYLLVRLERPEPENRITRAQCLAAMEQAPLHQRMQWEELRELTREL